MVSIAETSRGTKRDDRWERWVAKGEAHDREVKHRVQVTSVVIASTAAIALAVTLAFR